MTLTMFTTSKVTFTTHTSHQHSYNDFNILTITSTFSQWHTFHINILFTMASTFAQWHWNSHTWHQYFHNDIDILKYDIDILTIDIITYGIDNLTIALKFACMTSTFSHRRYHTLYWYSSVTKTILLILDSTTSCIWYW